LAKSKTNATGSNMPAVYFIVRAAVIDPATRAAFDAWCSREHVRDFLATNLNAKFSEHSSRWIETLPLTSP
jgi:hypothetical protein